MNPVHWLSDMRVGQPRMDAAHESLLRELEALEACDDSSFCDNYCSMVRRVENDFREEERLMEDIDFPGLHAHREQHARILAALHQVASQVMGGDLAVGRVAATLLPQWFMVHLATMDTALALALELVESENAETAARAVG